MNRLLWIVLVSIGVWTNSVRVGAEELRTLDGKSITGAVAGIADAGIVLKTDAGKVVVPLAQVLAVEFRTAKGLDAAGAKYAALRLIDDTTLWCDKVTFRAKEVEAKLVTGMTLKVPLGAVLSWQEDAGNRDHKKKWDELASPKIKRDRIVILRDGALDALEGLLGDADAGGDSIQFKREGSDAPVPILFERLHGLVFWRPDPVQESPICKVIDRDGNAVQAVKLGWQDGVLTAHTTFGAKLEFKSELLAKLDFNFGRLSYLSDLEPAKVVEKSGIGLLVRYRRDVNLDGEPIVLDKQYGKGLSMHAHTELEYNLAGKYKDLKGILGVDTRIGADSQARVTILCDGEKRFSEVITAKGHHPVALSVKDVQTLKIVVSSRNFLDLHDHVTFAEARVSQ
jgi:hypothetical protein